MCCVCMYVCMYMYTNRIRGEEWYITCFLHIWTAWSYPPILLSCMLYIKLINVVFHMIITACLFSIYSLPLLITHLVHLSNNCKNLLASNSMIIPSCVLGQFHERVLTTKQIQQHEVIKDAILYPRIRILIFNALLSKTK